jgi:hypothetical protein
VGQAISALGRPGSGTEVSVLEAVLSPLRLGISAWWMSRSTLHVFAGGSAEQGGLRGQVRPTGWCARAPTRGGPVEEHACLSLVECAEKWLIARPRPALSACEARSTRRSIGQSCAARARLLGDSRPPRRGRNRGSARRGRRHSSRRVARSDSQDATRRGCEVAVAGVRRATEERQPLGALDRGKHPVLVARRARYRRRRQQRRLLMSP